MTDPQVILLFSGKRKSGKDYICENLKKLLGDDKCTIVRISAPLKSLYAENHNLDLNELMSDSPYKEKYRIAMIEWSDEIRLKQPGYFCKAACDQSEIKPIWIVSDIRRKTDIKWFKETYQEKIKTIRVIATEETRKSRNWVFTKGVDDVTSECDLDDFTDWDLQIQNNNNDEFDEGIQQILKFLTNYS